MGKTTLKSAIEKAISKKQYNAEVNDSLEQAKKGMKISHKALVKQLALLK